MHPPAGRGAAVAVEVGSPPAGHGNMTGHGHGMQLAPCDVRCWGCTACSSFVAMRVGGCRAVLDWWCSLAAATFLQAIYLTACCLAGMQARRKPPHPVTLQPPQLGLYRRAFAESAMPCRASARAAV